ncbi:hypothetical protein PGB90_008624 [Kerria lacca]
MNTDSGIICFQHCHSSVFCKVLPQMCPVCGKKLEQSNVIPFRMPFPFVRAGQTPCAILIKPSSGDFLNCYSVDSDLHIGITNSDCVIVEYYAKGLCNTNTDLWNECLIVYQLKNDSWCHRWNSVLKLISDHIRFSSEKYDEDNFNCYSFVLEFVQQLDHEDFKASSKTKEMFCNKLVIPRLSEAYKYILLFRSIKNEDCVVKSG